MALSWPVEGPISQQFGSNPNSIQPNGHTGIDFAVPTGTPILASDSGTIVFEGWATTLSASNPWWIAPAAAGVCVIINHNNGIMSVYGHLSKTVINNGQTVKKGQLIGYSGATGLATGPHLHFEIFGWPLQPYNGYYGRLNPNGRVSGFAGDTGIAKNQREVGAYGVKERKSASTTSTELRVYKPGDVLTFKGYVRGQSVSGNNIWFVGFYSGTYFHSSGFKDTGTHDLPDLTPAPAPAPAPALTPTQRKVAVAVKYRKAPTTTAEVIIEYKAGDVLNFSHFTRGETVSGNNIWFKGALSGGYAWSGAFENKSTTGLIEEVAPAPAPTPTPTPVPSPTPAPVPAKYAFTPDFDFVEVIPAALPNFMFGNFPTNPEKVVIHQFGTLGVDTLNSTINTFTNPNMERVASSHFVVSGKRIIQMVSLKDRAYHAGTVGNNYVGIETDPAQDADTIASTKRLLAALKEKYGYELTKTLHKDVSGNSTNCGASITLSKYDLAPVVVIPPTNPVPVPVPTPVPAPVPTPSPVPDEEAIISAFLQFLKSEYFKSK